MAGLFGWLLGTLSHKEEFVRHSKYNTVLPRHCHMELTSEMLRGRPVFVVGDVHGCLEELNHLLQLANSRCEDPFVVFVGDMVNKGPHNVEVFKLVRQMVRSGQAAAVRGNHEEAVLRMRDNCKSTEGYTLPDRCQWLNQITVSDYAFLEELPYTISIPSHNALVVHAGLIPGIQLEYQSLTDMTHMRNIIQEDYFFGRGLVATNKLTLGEPWGSLWPGPQHVYFGHDARRRLQQWPYATGLDTGCLYGGDLTGALVGHGGGPLEILRVAAKSVYLEPGE